MGPRGEEYIRKPKLAINHNTNLEVQFTVSTGIPVTLDVSRKIRMIVAKCKHTLFVLGKQLVKLFNITFRNMGFGPRQFLSLFILSQERQWQRHLSALLNVKTVEHVNFLSQK